MGWMDGKHTKKTERGRMPGEGRHRIRIDVLETFTKSGEQWTYGEVPKLTARVVSSPSEAVGAEVAKIWFVNDARDKWGYTREEVVALGRAMAESIGRNPADIDAVKKLLREAFNPDHEEQYRKFEQIQPLRGLDLWLVAVKDGQYMRYSFEPITHTKEQIKSQREQLEDWKAGRLPDAKPTASPAAAAAPATADDFF